MTPYHHGSLRSALLAEAREVIAVDGVDAVTMRGLAKRVGVSHGAPGRHFPDRDALLDEVAAEGFAELTAILRAADVTDDIDHGLRHYIAEHVRFATTNAALMELMFSTSARGPRASAAADEFFTQGRGLLGDSASGPPGPLVYAVTAMVEGIGALAVSGRLPAERVNDVIDCALELLWPAMAAQRSPAHWRPHPAPYTAPPHQSDKSTS